VHPAPTSCGEPVFIINEEGLQADSVLIDLGLPPGFDVQTEDLDTQIARDLPADDGGPTLERYELTGRQILIYANHLRYGQPLVFSYRLRAKFPLIAQTPANTGYDYYNPEVSGQAVPQTLHVTP
jgi:uncharacterized protein YfaS (alpha-2-macroglobulin family)